MKKTGLLPVLLVLGVMINSCGDSGGGQVLLPNVSGSSGEMLVVLERSKWEGSLGNKIREVLAAPVDRLPQPEPEFDLVNVSPEAFSRLYQTHRNVLFVDTSADNEKKVRFQENTYSFSQLLINLEGRDEQDIIDLLDEEGQKIIDKANIAERDRWISVYKKSLNSVIFNKMRDKYHMNVYIPANFALDVEEDGFLWFSYETPTTTQSVLVHYFDHADENYFNKDSIRRIRNGLTKAKVQGTTDGTYMTIEDQVPIEFNMFRFRQRNFAEMRGLWTLKNGFMGGPFVTLVTRDEVNGRFVMLDGFVYAPNDNKRELLRQVEAIIYTISFPDETEVVVTPEK